MLAEQTVHTSGVNWTSVAVIVGSSCTILTILGSAVGRYVSGRITASIAEFQVNVVATLRDRLTTLESKIDTIDTNNPKRIPRKPRRQ